VELAPPGAARGRARLLAKHLLAKILYKQSKFLGTRINTDEHGAEFIIANQGKLSPQQEMVADLMAVIEVFSSRLDGLRRYKKR